MIVNISVNKIKPHPDNPRKDLGNLDELTKSIEKNGVMQNLTIIPEEALTKEPEEQPGIAEISSSDEFYVLIGHRRLEAAKKAGLKEVQCKIVTNISRKKQLGIMLEENMQRNDLTIYEQAQGFQMMLDLGETVESIVEKTGFSKTTVYHRLNIAKLNQKELQKKEEDSDFQLSLKDLIELEKVKKVSTRNKILKDSNSSANLAYRARQAAKEEKQEENKNAILKKLKDRNLKPAPEGVRTWTSGWEEVKTFDLDRDVPDKVSLKKTDKQLYYLINYGWIHIMQKADKAKEEKQGLSEEEKQKRRDKKRFKSINDNLNSNILSFIKSILKKDVDWIEPDEFLDMIWRFIVIRNVDIDFKDLYMEMSETDRYWWNLKKEEQQDLQETFEKLPTAYQMLTAAYISGLSDVYSYNLTYQSGAAEQTMQMVEILELFGFSISEEEQQLLDGTFELYRK